jgi:hypothetical protein
MFEDLNEFLKGKDPKFEAEMNRINDGKNIKVKITRNSSKPGVSTVYPSHTSSAARPISSPKEVQRRINRL